MLPRRRLQLESLCETLMVAPPLLLKSYLELGAWVCGEPAHDAADASASLPILMPLARMRARDARQFLAAAA